MTSFEDFESNFIVCKCCKKIFFTKNEYKKLCDAEQKLKNMHVELEKLEKDNFKKINEIYNDSHISIVDLYINNNDVNKECILKEKTRIEHLIHNSVVEKKMLQSELKLKYNYTEEDEQIMSRMYKIKQKCVSKCCKDCDFGWYCKKCCFTLKFNSSNVIKTCGISLMKRLLNVNNKCGKYRSLSMSDIYLLQNRFKNEMKYGLHSEILRGKKANLKELRDEQYKKVRTKYKLHKQQI